MLAQFKWLLACMLLLISTAALSQLASADAEISASEAFELVKEGKVTLVDIRRPEEWRQTGVAQGALRINMLNPKGLQGFAQEVYNAVGGDLNAPIVLICRTGSRTSRLQPILAQAGFTKVKHIPEGTLGNPNKPGWIAQGLPIEACKNC